MRHGNIVGKTPNYAEIYRVNFKGVGKGSGRETESISRGTRRNASFSG